MYPIYTKICDINTKYQAAAGPAQAKGRAWAGPGPARPLAELGRLFVFLCIPRIYLEII